MAQLCGIWGRPYVDLEKHIDTSAFPELHEEICWGLTQIEPWYTGGSLKWMDVVAPSVHADPYIDYGHVIERFTREDFVRFISLSDDPEAFDLERWREYRFGDETEHPLTKAQMRWLEFRHGVYFPWKVVFHLIENKRWDDKHSGDGKDFVDEAKEHFPKTVAFIRNLPFREIGRCVIFGLEANHHAPLHRDSEPGKSEHIAQSISFCPAGNKRFYLTDGEERERVVVKSRAYWFNDMDWHGVLPDPYFRYSVRVDGVFEPGFLKGLMGVGRKRR